MGMNSSPFFSDLLLILWIALAISFTCTTYSMVNGLSLVASKNFKNASLSVTEGILDCERV
jgi:hypothetical protein